MNIETIDISRLRLPRTPRRALGQSDNRWIEAILNDVGADAVSCVAAPDRLAGSNDPVVHNGHRLLAA